jgi:hypothetical protein
MQIRPLRVPSTFFAGHASGTAITDLGAIAPSGIKSLRLFIY